MIDLCCPAPGIEPGHGRPSHDGRIDSLIAYAVLLYIARLMKTLSEAGTVFGGIRVSVCVPVSAQTKENTDETLIELVRNICNDEP